MKYTEPGVIGDSFVNFTIPSGFARSALYCCPEVGYFYCNSSYDIRRQEKNDWFLMCYICSGTMTFQTTDQDLSTTEWPQPDNGPMEKRAGGTADKTKNVSVSEKTIRSFTAGENEIVLLDCRKSHRYFCPDSAEFMWFHFYGNSSVQYTEYLVSQGNIVFGGEQILRLRPSFSSLLRQAGAAFVNEHQISREIGNILCALATSQRSSSLIQSPVTPALTYIANSFSDTVDLDQMAELCMISKPHLIRCFKKELGCTPHDYLIDYRLRQAKEMLVATSRTVEEIADQCGFNSISHFSRAFKNRVGMSPSEYRNMW